MTAHAIAVLVLLGGPTVALAQPAATTAERAESPDEVEARVIYEEAIRALESGRRSEGLDALHRVVSRFSRSPFAEAARRKLAELGHPVVEPSLPARLYAPRNPDPVESGRWELIIGQTVLGGYYGLALSLAAVDDPSEDAVLWSGVGGALGSLGASVLGTRDFALHDGYAHLHLHFQAFSMANVLLALIAAEGRDERAYFGGTGPAS